MSTNGEVSIEKITYGDRDNMVQIIATADVDMEIDSNALAVGHAVISTISKLEEGVLSAIKEDPELAGVVYDPDYSIILLVTAVADKKLNGSDHN